MSLVPEKFTIYTDGASRKNGAGSGGYAAICVETSKCIASGGEAITTNNRMELRAVIEGLNSLPAGSNITVVTDSEYVALGFTKWLPNWVAKNWPMRVKNRDLWEHLTMAVERHELVEWQIVKGHSTSKWNNLADEIAGEEADARCA